MMNSKELKKKIEDILEEYNFEIDYGKGWILDTEEIAEALIAEGIGDISSEKAMRELAEAFHREKCAEYDLLNYQMQKSEYRVVEAEHRAEVAERAGRIIQRDMARVFDISNPRVCELIANIWDLAKKQAEKELAEERKNYD